MASSTVQPPNPLAWLVAPTVICVIASIVMATPIELFGLRPPEPVWAMAPAFAWAVIRPSVLPPLALLGLGAFQDLLWGGALGFWPLCLLTLYGFGFLARPVLSGQGFWSLFAWYVAACAGAFAIGVLLTILVSDVVPNLIGVGLQFVVTAALFPLAWRLIDAFEDADVRFR